VIVAARLLPFYSAGTSHFLRVLKGKILFIWVVKETKESSRGRHAVKVPGHW
jgi:hypothetical protein